MNLARARRAQHLHDAPARRAAHDRVVHQHDALAAHVARHGVELRAHADLAHALIRLDERAADIAVLRQAVAVGDAALLGIAHRRRQRAVRHADDHVRLHVVADRQPPAGLHAGLIDVHAVDDRIRPGKVHELKQAQAAAQRRGHVHAVHAALVDRHDLAGADVAHELRADRIERAALAGQHEAVPDAPKAQRTDAVRIADANEAVLCQQDERVAAAYHLHHRADGLQQALAALSGDEVQNDLGVHRRLEDGALVLHGGAQRVGVDEVAVVRQRQHAHLAAGDDRLGVDDVLAAEGRVAHMADGDMPGQPAQDLVVKHLGHQAEVAVLTDDLAVRRGDAGALLPAVLQGEEAVVRGARRLDVAALRVDAEDPAGLLHPVALFLDVLRGKPPFRVTARR